MAQDRETRGASSFRDGAPRSPVSAHPWFIRGATRRRSPTGR